MSSTLCENSVVLGNKTKKLREPNQISDGLLTTQRPKVPTQRAIVCTVHERNGY